MTPTRRAFELAQKALHAPPRAVVKEVSRRVTTTSTRWARRERDRVMRTYSDGAGLQLARVLPQLDIDWTGSSGDALAGVCGRYVEHRFDLLGSGWTEVTYGRNYRGTEGHRFGPGSPVTADPAGAWLVCRVNPANLAHAKRVWALVGPGYEPIDWHVDYKSGFRWPTTDWYLDVAYGSVLGADVKAPWELARSQHLPRLALAYGAAAAGDPRFLPPLVYMNEVTDQILDFIATNPPRYGVNWRCTMDVGIRVANWLVACDLLQSYGAQLDGRFMAVLTAAVVDHARFIVNNLEWHPLFRSNHYLADICGLAFAAAYLSPSPESNKPSELEGWRAKATQELASETALQFYPDGGNKEASVCYHRLSAEMVVYTTALLCSTGAGDAWRQRQHAAIERALGFTAWVTKDSGSVPQVGDNDSGRFLALAPLPTAMTVAQAKARWANLDGYDELADTDVHWAAQALDHTPLLVAGEALLGAPRGGSFAKVLSAELSWAAGADGATSRDGALGAGTKKVIDTCRRRWRGAGVPLGDGHSSVSDQLGVNALEAAGGHDVVRWKIVPADNGESLLEGMQEVAFPDFGIFVLRSRRLYLAVRCGPGGQEGSGGHSHNDQLGLEVEVDGRPWYRDPGSYLYTPLPAKRNAYRSAQAHLVPRYGTAEPGDLEAGLFLLADRAHAHCLHFGRGHFSGAHYGYGLPTVRELHVTVGSVEVSDAVPKGAAPRSSVLGPTTVTSPQELRRVSGPGLPFSPGYGSVERRDG